MGGIILTGGGSNMPEIDKVFKTHTHIDKVRIAKFVNQTSQLEGYLRYTNHDGTMNTVLGLLAKGDMNCAGDEINTDLFDNLEDGPTTPRCRCHKAPRNPNETVGTGVVLTAAEKQKAEEEARRKKNRKRKRPRLWLKRKPSEEARRRKENSLVHRGS